MDKIQRDATILVVDDEKAYCQAVADILGRYGFAVVQAHGVREAKTVLAAITVDAILLDVMMPEVDGLTMLGELSTVPSFLNVALVIVSAKSTPADRSEALKKGADAYLAKPYTVEELLKVLDGVLSRPDVQGTAPLGQYRMVRTRLAELDARGED